jgi:hypothetical protein
MYLNSTGQWNLLFIVWKKWYKWLIRKKNQY